MAFPSSSSSLVENLDTDPHTSQPFSTMPRAPPTPLHGDPLTQDPLNLNGLSQSLPIYLTAAMATTHQNLPAIQFPSTLNPTSHPILGLHIHNHIKFQVNAVGAELHQMAPNHGSPAHHVQVPRPRHRGCRPSRADR
jgi:hypothetical protein